MKKIIFLSLFVLWNTGLCFPNMASPIKEGTLSSMPLTSRGIDILKEKIHVIPDKDFKTAVFKIEYIIKTDIDGRQIPLLFHAVDYQGDFIVRADGKEVKLLDIPKESGGTPGTQFEGFGDSFEHSNGGRGTETITIYWDEKSGHVYKLNDLKYFEIELGKGEHIIQVEYTARARTDRSGWVNEYSFKYSLSPAKKWKSFGTLDITVDASKTGGKVITNLGQPANGKTDSTAVWHFKEIPQNTFEINYTPEISSFAKTMISLDPSGLAFIFGIVLVLIHTISIYLHRRKVQPEKTSWVVITGSIIIPLLTIIFFIMSFGIIDDIIGPDAGRYHGYNFLVIIFYPVLMPLYWLIMWLIDKAFKRIFYKTANK